MQETACDARHLVSVSESGRFPGVGNGNPPPHLKTAKIIKSNRSLRNSVAKRSQREHNHLNVMWCPGQDPKIEKDTR